MKKLISNITGGMPAYLEDLKYLQEMIRELADSTFKFLPSDKFVILNGVVINISPTNFTSTEGWVWHNGEYYYCPAQSDDKEVGETLRWFIETSFDVRGDKIFKDDDPQQVFEVKILILNFESVGGVELDGNTKFYTDFVGGVPLGSIIMWSGITIPDGWALCDGTVSNGYTTPNLRGRFIAGYQETGDADYDSPGNLSDGGTDPGKTGGSKTTILTLSKLPFHTHGRGTLVTYGGGAGVHKHALYTERPKYDPKSGGSDAIKNIHSDKYSSYNDHPVSTAWENASPVEKGSHEHSIVGDIDSEGSVDPTIDRRSPYYTLAYIMKTS